MQALHQIPSRDAMQAALGFVISQTTHIETNVYQIKYADIRYPSLIPVDTSAHPFATTVTYFSMDKAGAAAWINGNADDIPRAVAEREKFETQVYTAGIGYGYGWEEINQAQMLGMNLSQDGAMAARRAYEEFVDGVAFDGDTTKNFEGLINHSAVTAVAATTGTWSSATPDQILTDVNDALTYVHVTNTNHVSMADTVILPQTQFNLIASKRLTDTSMTVLEYLLRANVYTATTGQPLTIRGMRGLATAGVSSDPRMIAYRRSPEVLKLHIPMPHRFLPVYQQSPLRWDVPGVFRLGGLDVRLPKEIVYVDGL